MTTAETITKLFPSSDSARDWYDNFGPTRTLSSSFEVDPDDPRATMRGGGQIDIGDGILRMVAGAPRYYIAGNFRNIEFTYYLRITEGYDNSGWTSSTGTAVGYRTNHYDINDDPCNAPTYYTKLWLQSGDFGYNKEFYHGGYTIYSNIIPKADTPIPTTNFQDRFIGIKAVCQDTDKGVLLRSYVDTTGGVDGGDWQLYFEKLDEYPNATWPASGFTNDDGFPCNYNFKINGSQNFNAPFTFNGSHVFLRTDSPNDMQWKWISVREIDNLKTPPKVDNLSYILKFPLYYIILYYKHSKIK